MVLAGYESFARCENKELNNMEKKSKEFCTHDGKIYPHGTEDCISGKCKICSAGEWKERVQKCVPSNSGEIK